MQRDAKDGHDASPASGQTRHIFRVPAWDCKEGRFMECESQQACTAQFSDEVPQNWHCAAVCVSVKTAWKSPRELQGGVARTGMLSLHARRESLR